MSKINCDLMMIYQDAHLDQQLNVDIFTFGSRSAGLLNSLLLDVDTLVSEMSVRKQHKKVRRNKEHTIIRWKSQII